MSTGSAEDAVVLVVDDLAANIRLLEAILAPRGYRVVAARSGPEALAAAVECAPDLVLLDIQMPDMTGYEVCRRLRADPSTAMVPVVMITASGNEEKVLAIEAGADDFVLRPFDQAELIARVRSLVRLKRYHDTIEVHRAELAAWAETLEERVREQVDELDRLRELRRFLPPQVADVVLNATEQTMLDPHRTEVAIAFCDLRGFTSFSAAAEPEEALLALRGFHDVVGALVAVHGATVGWFAGDGVMLVFNDPVPIPEPARAAATLAVELRERVAPLVAEWERRGHSLGVAVGISYGFATLGVLGFEGRYDYTAVGPVVNQASRLCDRAATNEILMTQRAHHEVEDVVDATAIGELPLRGFPTPVPAWRLSDVTRGSDDTAVAIDVLGPLRVRRGDAVVPVNSSRERQVLALLAVHLGAVVPVERLASEIWEDASGDAAVAALRVQVSRLRKTLAAAGVGDLLVTEAPGYRLRLDPDALDATRFDRDVSAARMLAAADSEAGVTALREALAYWRGPVLADITPTPSITAITRGLDEKRLVAIEDRIDAELRCGLHREVLAELESLVVDHPRRERFWAQRMLALYRSGRQQEAFRAYRELHDQLVSESGLEPSAALARLEHQIVTRDPVLEVDGHRYIPL